MNMDHAADTTDTAASAVEVDTLRSLKQKWTSSLLYRDTSCFFCHPLGYLSDAGPELSAHTHFDHNVRVTS